ncbi:hypothetical protein BGZ95_011120 [Linnemannia exigua]|uniref:Spindle pole body component n=1 Tax=Linnemannia exigua TaxID=604196 RepID=A0AAD4H4I5_9FUNG|nr:hypothetical protein BGZ95_011120 [Linnemannia exigua]
MDHGVIDKRVYGLAEKFSMKGQDQKGEALKGYQERLRRLARSMGGGDQARTLAERSEADQEEAAQNVVSSVLMILLELSETPTVSRKGEYGYVTPDALRPGKAPKTQQQINKELWTSILKEDPFAGDHWRQTGAVGVILESDSGDSDFEDMDVNPRAVPVSAAEDLGSTSKVHDGNKDIQRDTRIWMHKDIPRSHALPAKALERQQYWQDGDIVSKLITQPASGQALDYNIQCASDLNSAFHNSRDYVLAHSIPVMDEIDIIHEMSSKITTSHLSPGSLSAILLPFQDSATVIRTLQTLADRICSASAQVHGKVIQTFASAIQLELIEFKKYMASVQRKYHRQFTDPSRNMASLIELEATLSGRFSLAHEPSNGDERACLHSVELLSRLYETAQQLELCSDTLASAMFRRLLQQAIRPFLLNMERWLAGQPLDSASEFMIKLSPQVDLFSTQFWSDGYQVQAEIVTGDGKNAESDTSTVQVSPCFVSDLTLQQLLYAGKAMQITLALKAFEASIPTATGFATLVSQQMFEECEGRESMDCNNEATTSIRALEQDFPGYTNILGHQYPLTPLPPLISNAAGAGNHTDNNSASGFIWRMESELAKAIHDQYLLSNSILKSLLFSQSRLQWHLKGMSEFFFMMQGEVMHLFAASVFSKMKRKRPWLDSYALESTFHQVATLSDWKYAKFVKVRVGEGKRPWTDLMRLRAQTLELIEFDYMVLDVQIQKFQSEIEGQGDLDNMIRLSQRFISMCYERCFLKERTLPLHRSLMTMLNLALEFSALFSSFISDRAEEDGSRVKSVDPARERIGRSGRRVSFNTIPTISRIAKSHFPIRSTGDINSDSEEDSFDEGQDWDGDQEQQGSVANLEEDEDIEMDPRESSSSVKKQRIDSNLTEFPRERSFHRREYRRTDGSRKTSQGGVGGGSYRESLEAIEQEFNRCREFLAKSLQVVVSSNAARGFAARRGGGVSTDQDARGEGDSDYLDGLILALSS